jgi:hypothetical protein
VKGYARKSLEIYYIVSKNKNEKGKEKKFMRE